jgi:hypothetical protein
VNGRSRRFGRGRCRRSWHWKRPRSERGPATRDRSSSCAVDRIGGRVTMRITSPCTPGPSTSIWKATSITVAVPGASRLRPHRGVVHTQPGSSRRMSIGSGPSLRTETWNPTTERRGKNQGSPRDARGRQRSRPRPPDRPARRPARRRSSVSARNRPASRAPHPTCRRRARRPRSQRERQGIGHPTHHLVRATRVQQDAGVSWNPLVI